MEKHRDACRDLHLVFIDLEKAFDRVPRELIWAALRNQKVPETYVKMTQDMYRWSRTKVVCAAGVTNEFEVKVGLHQGGVMSPRLFNLTLNYLLENKVEEKQVIDLDFADDTVLVSDDVTAIQSALNKWREALEDNGFRISRTKTEYLYCPFSDPDNPTPDILLDGNVSQSVLNSNTWALL